MIISILVPDQPPQNVTTESLNSTAIRVCFFPPRPVNQNGLITSFTISYIGDLFQTQTQTMDLPISPLVYPLSTMLCVILTSLEEFNTYTITVEAVNSIGNGSESVGLMELTDQAGEYNFYLLRNTIIFTIFVILAPSAPPQNFTAISGRSISLTYMPPPLIDQNGVLTSFSIEYFGVDRDTTTRNITVPASQLSLNITQLNEDTTYMIRIRASTVVGFGPFSDFITATTQVVRK